MSGWKKVRLEDVCLKITDGAHHSPKTVEGSGIPMASVKDMTPFGLNLETCRHISYEDFEKLVRQGCKPEINDVLIAKDGNSCLDTVMVQREEQNVVLLSSVAILRPDTEKIDPEYLSLYLSNPIVKKHMKESLVSGSAIPRVVLKALREYEIMLPEYQVQKKIASILSTINNKIQLNLKINETLEEMAMTLYKHWFVDFGPFQDEEFVESELGMIPKGWKVIQVKDLGEVITGKTPSTKVKEYYGDKIPFIKIPDMHGNVYIVKTETMLSELGAQSQKNKMLPPNTVCVSCIATPGLVVLTSEMSQTNQQINSVVCKEGVSPYFVYLFFKSISDNIVTLGSGGTATLNLNKGDFSRIKLLMPTNEVMTGFNNKVESIFNLIKINSLNNIELENLRDYLLPRLLSGEIDVSKAEKQVEEVL